MRERQQQELEERELWERLEQEISEDERLKLHRKIYPKFKRECDERKS